MKRITCLFALLAITLFARPAAGQSGQLLTTSTASSITSGTISSSTSSGTNQATGVIVRTNLGLLGLQAVCLLNGCSVEGNLDGTQGLVFLVQPPQGLSPNILAAPLGLVSGIIDAEPDQLVALP